MDDASRNQNAWKGGCLGAFFGGVALPIGFGFYAWLILRDAGGPLFWPLLSLVGASFGAVIGSGIGALLRRR